MQLKAGFVKELKRQRKEKSFKAKSIDDLFK